MRIFTKNIRTLFTVWYSAVLAVMMLFFLLITLAGLYWNLLEEIEYDLENDYELIESNIVAGENGELSFPAASDPLFHDLWFEIWSFEGRLLFQSKPMHGQTLGPAPRAEYHHRRLTYKSRTISGGRQTRQLSGVLRIQNQPLFIRIASSEENLWHEITETATVMLISFLIMLLIAAGGGYLLTRHLLRPIDQITRKTNEINAQNLSERLPVANSADEMDRLTITINAMLERLEQAFERQRQFTSDAAHELRTPLSALRSVGEVGMSGQKSPAEYRDIMGSMLEESERLTRLVDNLLVLTRADSDKAVMNREPLDLGKLVSETIEIVKPLAEEKQQNIAFTGNEPSVISADAVILQQALFNIIHNAIKYSSAGRTISIVLKKSSDYQAVIEIQDNGPGIAPEHQQKIFERFYRVDSGRAKASGGSGLGLSIARWAVESHGGKIEVDSQLNAGSLFRIILPLEDQ
jgi:heavy metal sensor kinase